MPVYSGSTNVAPMGDGIYALPTKFKTVPALKTKNVMQDVVYKNGGTLFITQGPQISGTNGLFTTIVNRVNYSDGTLIDSMELTNGGHGFGFEIEYASDGKTYVWMTWQGADNSNDFVRFPYKAGTFTRAQVEANGNFTKLPVQDGPEAVYHFDWQNDLALERHFEFDGSGETYKVRHISDIRNGVNTVYNQFKLATNKPTVQGFAIMQGAMFRYNGKGYNNNTPDSTDKITLQQVEYGQYGPGFTGFAATTDRTYNLSDSTAISPSGSGPVWRDGYFEPEGMSVFRESSGKYSLIIGDTTGLTGSGQVRNYHISKFSEVGNANGK